MASYNNRYGGKPSNVKKSGGKIGAGFWIGPIAFVLVVAILFSVIFWRTSAFTDPTFGFGEKPAAVNESDDKKQTENGGMFVSGGDEGHGIRLMRTAIAAADYEEYGISPLAESAVTIKATITPSNTPNQSVNWSVSFVDPSSAWANGKNVNNYITLATASDGALTATVTCKQAFGEKIKITVTSREDPTFFADCICDYSKKVTGFTLTAGGVNFSTSDASYTFEKAEGAVTAFNLSNIVKSTFSDYTLDDSFSVSATTVMNPVFINYLTSAGLTPRQTGRETFTLQGGSKLFYWQTSTPGGTQEVSLCGFTPEQANQAIEIAKQHTDIPVYTWNFTITGTHSTYEFSIPVYFAASSLTPVVTNVSLDNSTLLF